MGLELNKNQKEAINRYLEILNQIYREQISKVILSPLVMDEETYEWHKKYRDPLYNRIKKDGIDLWMNKPEFL